MAPRATTGLTPRPGANALRAIIKSIPGSRADETNTATELPVFALLMPLPPYPPLGWVGSSQRIPKFGSLSISSALCDKWMTG